jgi:hypothetical protein
VDRKPLPFGGRILGVPSVGGTMKYGCRSPAVVASDSPREVLPVPRTADSAEVHLLEVTKAILMYGAGDVQVATVPDPVSLG